MREPRETAKEREQRPAGCRISTSCSPEHIAENESGVTPRSSPSSTTLDPETPGGRAKPDEAGQVVTSLVSVKREPGGRPARCLQGDLVGSRLQVAELQGRRELVAREARRNQGAEVLGKAAAGNARDTPSHPYRDARWRGDDGKDRTAAVHLVLDLDPFSRQHLPALLGVGRVPGALQPNRQEPGEHRLPAQRRDAYGLVFDENRDPGGLGQNGQEGEQIASLLLEEVEHGRRKPGDIKPPRRIRQDQQAKIVRRLFG